MTRQLCNWDSFARQTATLILTVFLALTACNNPDNSKKTNSINSSSTAVHDTTANPEQTELIKKWTWDDTITRPLKSSISNAKFSSGLLFKTWTWSDENENQPVLTFKKDSLNIHAEKKYIYTINYDSLRIFTSYDHPGDGFTRGIITKLTKDSLIIKWSTDEDDINKYVPIKNK